MTGGDILTRVAAWIGEHPVEALAGVGGLFLLKSAFDVKAQLDPQTSVSYPSGYNAATGEVQTTTYQTSPWDLYSTAWGRSPLNPLWAVNVAEEAKKTWEAFFSGNYGNMR